MKYAAADAEHEALPNLLGLTSLAAVQAAETEGFLLAEQALLDTLRVDEVFDANYIRRIHRLALDRVYSFAGHYRTVNLSKGGFTFPAAQFLGQSMEQLEQQLLRPLPHSWPTNADLVRDVAAVHAELLFVHPFREGNGRTARLLANLMAYKNGSTGFDWESLAEPATFQNYVRAVQAASRLDYQPMTTLLEPLLR